MSDTTIKVTISGDEANASVSPVYAHKNGAVKHGLVVLTERLTDLKASRLLFANTVYGTAMNQDAAFSGVPVLVNDGTDNAAWTATNVVGTKMTPDSTDQAYTGTKSVEVDNANTSDVWQFDKGSTIDLTAYTAISMRVYVESDWDTGDSVEIYGWDGSGEVGVRVQLEAYFLFGEFDTWHSVVIPLVDMGLQASTTVTGLRMQQTAKSGKAPKFYMDVINIQEFGGSILFTAAPPPDTRYRVYAITLTFVDALAGTLADATMPALSYDKILAVATLANGIQLSHFIDGEPDFQAPFTSVADFLALGFKGARDAISDGTNTCLVLELAFVEPLIVEGNPDANYIGITVRDDLSGLIRFTAAIRGAIETDAKARYR